ncbi:MAG: phosphoribosyltransferase family protein, partial [Candidatus Peregrinibacteria bacterium]
MGILDLFFPKKCVGCEVEGGDVCCECFKELKFLGSQQCPGCRGENLDGRFCEGCENGFLFDRLVVCVEYEHGGVFSKLMVRFKYKYSSVLSELFGGILRGRVPSGYDVCVPVPIYRGKLRVRGFNQAKLLAEYCGLGVVDCLCRLEDRGAQAKLGRSGRMENLKGVVGLRDGFELAGKRVLLVDDVATTGSTLNECSRVLKGAGVVEV